MFSKWFSLLFLFSAGCLVGDLPGDEVTASDSRLWFFAASEPKTSVSPLYPARQESPDETVDNLRARSGEITEPSRSSEEQYVVAIRKWLESLEPFQREKARKIMLEAHPELHALREAIRDKKQQLAAISFDKGMPLETLPRLGMELQKLRSTLNAELRKVGDRLRHEAGVNMEATGKDSFWLSPPPLN